MTAKLKAVEGDGPPVLTAEMIAAALERFKADNETPLEYHDPLLGGVYRYRKLTGGEVQTIIRLATKADGAVDQQKLIYLAVNRATVEPKVDGALWAQLLQFPAPVAAGLSAAVQRAAGMTDDPVADAGKDWTASPD